MILSRIAARGLVRPEARVLDETPYGLSGKFIESALSLPELGKELLAHPGGPETLDVIFDTCDGIFARLGPKVIADIVCHLLEMLRGAHRLIICPYPLARASQDTSTAHS